MPSKSSQRKRAPRGLVPMAPGVYRITHVPTGRVYVGSGLNMARRCRTHRWQLNAGIHPNPALQVAWTADGPAAFAWAELERTDAASLQEAEQRWIDALRAGDPQRGFNLSSTAYSVAGYRFTPEQRQYQSEMLRRRYADPAARARLSAGRMGMKSSRAPKRSLRRFSDETVASIKAAAAAGTPVKRLARDYGVAEFTITSMVKGLTYREVQPNAC